MPGRSLDQYDGEISKITFIRGKNTFFRLNEEVCPLTKGLLKGDTVSTS